MKFVATKRGFYGNERIAENQEFDAPDDFEAKWAVPAEDFEPEEPLSEEEEAKQATEGAQGVHPDQKVVSGDESLIPPGPEDQAASKKASKKKASKKKASDS